MTRVPPSERTKEEIAALLGGELGSASLKSDLVRLAIQQIVEEALEGKVRDLLGRGSRVARTPCESSRGC
jgi:hypothetical protein